MKPKLVYINRREIESYIAFLEENVDNWVAIEYTPTYDGGPTTHRLIIPNIQNAFIVLDRDEPEYRYFWENAYKQFKGTEYESICVAKLLS
jgi:hypothetical protein